MIMAHFQRDVELWVSEGDLSALARGGQATTGEFCEFIMVAAAGTWFNKVEVAGGEGQKEC